MEKSKRVLSISQLNAYIKGVFDDEFVLQNITVYGEIEELKAAGRTTYITLAEKDCRLSCVSFLPLPKFDEGMSVELDGSVRFYQKSGKVSFVVTAVRPSGDGDKKLAFLKLRDELEKEGLFLKSRPLRKVIRSCCVITGETGVVIEDFKSVLRSAGAKIDIYILPIKIQGDGAENEIAAAIDIVNRHKFCDCAVLMRGGGSKADLEVFNTAVSARAVYSCAVPVIAAIGHEVDSTLCDLSADYRAGTPSIAAQMIADNFTAAETELNNLSQSLASLTLRLYNREHNRVINAARAVVYETKQKIALGFQRVRYLSGIMSGFAAAALERGEKRLSLYAAKLDALSPLGMLSKGFIRTERKGRAVLLASELSEGDEIKLYYADGKADAKILKAGEKYGV